MIIRYKRSFYSGLMSMSITPEDSDVDLAIFSDYFEGTPRIEGIKFLLSRARKYSSMDFQPTPFTYRDYLEKDGFVAEVLRKGVEIV